MNKNGIKYSQAKLNQLKSDVVVFMENKIKFKNNFSFEFK